MSTARIHHLIGVDGGGSGCRAAVGLPDGTVIGQGGGGPANATTDIDQTIRNVGLAIRAALDDAGLDDGALAHAAVQIGLAGVLGAAQSGPVARAFPAAWIVVSDDRPTSFAGALGDGAGALMGIGTGTLIVARNGEGLHGIGGWGLQVGDQASGAWLGRALLERAILCHDGLEAHSDLTRATLAQFPEGPAGIVGFASTARPSDYAGHAPAVVTAAAAGDATGCALMQRGAGYLDRAIAVLGIGEGDTLCLSGGIGPHYAAFLRADHRARLRPAKGNALDGAVELARRMAAEIERERP